MESKSHLSILVGLAMSGLVMTSCVDQAYDFEEVDMTLGTQADLVLPTSSTGTIRLASFLDIKEDGKGFIDSIKIGDNMVFYAKASGMERLKLPKVSNGNVSLGSPYLTSPIRFNNLPDFMKGEDVILDLQNPILIIDSEDIPAGEVEAEIDIKSYTGAVEQKSCKVSGLLDGQQYTVCQTADPGIPSGILQAGTYLFKQPQSGNLNDIIRKIPESIRIGVTSIHANQFATPVYNQDFSISYQLYAPIRIGADLHLCYQTTEGNWAKEYDEDIRKMDAQEFYIKGELHNTMPMDAIIDIIPIDTEGKAIPSLTTWNMQVNANAKSDVAYTLRSTDQQKTLGAYITGENKTPILNGVKIVCTLKTSPQHVGEYLKTNAAVRINKMQVGVRGNFSYNAN